MADEARGEGVPRRPPGPGDRLEPGAPHPASDLRHAGRRHGVRLRRVGELRQPRQADHGPRPRQDLALHGLVAAAAVAEAAHLCAGRRHPPARRLPAPQGRAREGRARRAGSTRRWRGSSIPRTYEAHPGGGLAPPQAARQEPQGAGRADRARGLARAGRAGAGRAAQPHPARRGALRHRQPRADGDRAALPAAHAERGFRQVGARQGDRRGR